MSNLIVVSVGGSLVVPDDINIKFLEKLKERIEGYIQTGYKFILICGGGNTARNYQAAARSLVELTPEDIDWIGIHATRLNAHLLRTIFYQHAEPKIVTNPTEKNKFTDGKSIMIAAGWRPGFSTDYCAVKMAVMHGAKKIVNLSNVDYVYNKDPRINKDAKPFSHLSWDDFIDILPENWSPGLKTPFDPVAAREARELGMEVVIINGNHLERLDGYLANGEFKGTTVS